jgi:hypothetical protein
MALLSLTNLKSLKELHGPLFFLFHTFTHIQILGFSLRRLYATPSIYSIHTSSLSISSSYLFYTIFFGLNGHRQVYKIIDENFCSVVTLLYLHFANKTKCL